MSCKLENIKILKPILLNNDNIFFGIQDVFSPLIIETDFAFIKYRPIIYDSGYCIIDIQGDDKFINKIEEIEKHVCNRLSKKYSKYIENFQYSKGILRTRTMKIDSVEVYDYNKNKTSINKLSNGDKVRLLIQIDKYIYNPNKSYLNYKIIQIQMFSICNKLDDIYDPSKYMKMLKLGIPLTAVHHKMKMDGLDESIINGFNGEKPCGSNFPPPPPKLPPPPPPLPIRAGINPMSAVLGDIKGGNFLLKKAPPKDELDKAKKDKILRCVDTSRKVPSLMEIQNALNNLKKIK